MKKFVFQLALGVVGLVLIGELAHSVLLAACSAYLLHAVVSEIGGAA